MVACQMAMVWVVTLVVGDQAAVEQPADLCDLLVSLSDQFLLLRRDHSVAHSDGDRRQSGVPYPLCALMASSIFAHLRVPLRVMQREMMSGRVFLVTRKLTSYSSQCSGSVRSI